MRDAIHSTLLRATIESAEFQCNGAEVISAPGAKALVSAAKNSTRLSNFAVKALDTGCGIEGTTSRTPAKNGYKGYLSGPVATDDTEGASIWSTHLCRNCRGNSHRPIHQ